MVDLEGTLGKLRFDNLMEGLVRKRYHCLLGAGASVGGHSQGPVVRALPKGNELANAINDDFSLGMPHNHNLKAVYAELIETVGPMRMSEIDMYFKSWFTNTTPPSWMKAVCSVPWARIWTLNIDDCLERTYNSNTRTARQNLISRSWTERHLNPGPDTVLAIHLHGKASRGPRDLIFDISAYLKALTEGHRWHKVFADDYGADPFIILGASLDSELDLDGVISAGKQHIDDFPSLIVLPGSPDYQIRTFERRGLIYIDSTAEDFFDAVVNAFPRYLEAMSSKDAALVADSAPQIEEFLTTWRELKVNPIPVTAGDRKHDFYSGHQPEWRDITSDLAIDRRISDSIENDVISTAAGGSHLTLLLGSPFSGKSTELLSLAKRLVAQDYRVFLHSGEYAPDADSIRWWLEHHPRTVLLFDNGKDFAMDVGRILAETEGPGTLRVVMSERHSGRPIVERNVPASATRRFVIGDHLNARERGLLVSKLTENHRLGALTGFSDREVERYFKDRRNLLFQCMADLEKGGRGFMQRLSQERDSLVGSPVSSRLCDSVAAANYCGYPLPARIAHQLCGDSPGNIGSIVSGGNLSDLLMTTTGGYTFRHHYIGERVFKEFVSADEKFDLLRDLALALAPHVTIEAITRRALEYRLARTVMSADSLANLLTAQKAFDWYECLEKEYDWNARFWEQRALAAAEIQAWERAFSWALLAVDRRGKPDAYTFTTVGVVLLKRCASETTTDRWPADLFEEAVEYLERAYSMEGTRAEYPISAFFGHVTPLLQRHPRPDDSLKYQLATIWSRWRRNYTLLDQSLQRRVQTTVDRSYLAWERWYGA